MTFHKIGAAMIGPELIGQPATAKGNGRQRHGDITGIRIERDAYPAVTIAGQVTDLAEWEVYVDVPDEPLGPASPNAETPASPPDRNAVAAESLTGILIHRQASEYPDEDRPLTWWPDGPGVVVEYTDADGGARTVYLPPEEAVRYLLPLARP